MCECMEDYFSMCIILMFFQIQPGDGLPANVCEQCENLVNICYNFKLQVEQSDFTLQKYYASQQEHLPFPQVWCRLVLNFIIK
jgi:hypothetical protein